jgi:imidazole glycerol-phosphate synthase subunit HisH
MQTVVIIDFGMGNLRSVYNKFRRLNLNVLISSNPQEIELADKLILPGIGHFANGMRNLKEYGWIHLLNKKVIKAKTPILGICLGMQLLTEYSEEGNMNGLGWLNARTVRFKIADTQKWKVPHMGWNNLHHRKDHTTMKDIPTDAMFYFVHSYHVECADTRDILSTTKYDYEFVSAVQHENIFGMQFHPEKSHDNGALLLKNFIDNC